MNAYVYIRSERTLWTVGFYRPDGTWEPESDHASPEDAAKRVRYLNGGREEPGLVGIDNPDDVERADDWYKGDE